MRFFFVGYIIALGFIKPNYKPKEYLLYHLVVISKSDLFLHKHIRLAQSKVVCSAELLGVIALLNGHASC